MFSEAERYRTIHNDWLVGRVGAPGETDGSLGMQAYGQGIPLDEEVMGHYFDAHHFSATANIEYLWPFMCDMGIYLGTKLLSMQRKKCKEENHICRTIFIMGVTTSSTALGHTTEVTWRS